LYTYDSITCSHVLVDQQSSRCVPAGAYQSRVGSRDPPPAARAQPHYRRPRARLGHASGIERGRRNPTWSKLTGLADGLGIPVVKIVEDAEAEAQLTERMRIARSELGLSERFA
jgi:hypothetical protein